MQFHERRPGWGLVLAIVGVAFLAGIISGGVAGGLVAVLVPHGEQASSRSAPASAGEAQGPTTLLKVQEESAITDAVKKVTPGVVTLIVEASSRDAVGRQITETNLGSGVVIDPRGYILTNEHVVENATKITVKLSSGEERPGVLVGDDSPFTDIAVVRVQPDGLTAVPIADSDGLQLGQEVLAIGSIAFGPNATDFRNTVTRGVVSGLHRRWPRDDVVMEDLIQTDAAVNHGNSGGALVDLAGDLVGITTTVVRGTDNGFQVQGVAFAISSRTFQPVVDALIRTGKVERPYIGIVHQQITDQIAQQNNLPVRNGAAVVQVTPGSPADKAGIRPGDIITNLAGTDITEDNPYLNVLVKQRPGTTVPITVLRNGRSMTMDVAITTR